MDHKQQENRRKANQKFMHSLDELETVLQSEERQEGPPQPPSAAQTAQPKSPAKRTVNDGASFGELMDEALQDIEQFMSEPSDDRET
jgi:hypothetical protein